MAVRKHLQKHDGTLVCELKNTGSLWDALPGGSREGKIQILANTKSSQHSTKIKLRDYRNWQSGWIRLTYLHNFKDIVLQYLPMGLRAIISTV